MQRPAPPPSPPDDAGRLRDGTRVRIRPAQPADRYRVVEFLKHVSRSSLELRYLAACRPEMAATEILAPAGPTERNSMLLELVGPTPAPVIAHGEFIRSRTDPSRAEVAFLVADDRQGEGAATLLLTVLARRARALGVLRFDAVTYPENQAMIDVFVGAGFPCSLALRDQLVQVALDISKEPSGDAFAPPPSGDRPG